jgi:hypothetical protein
MPRPSLNAQRNPTHGHPHFATQDSCADTGAFAFEKNFAQKITPPRSNVSSNRHNNTTQPFSCRLEAYYSPSRKSHNNSRTRNSRCTQLKLSSLELRYRCYTDLLATYNNDHTPSTKRESKRKAKIVTNTIKSEQCRVMFANIRTTVKPQTNGSLSKILVPRHRNTTEYPDNYQDFLSRNSDEDVVWDSLLDQSAIDTNLLRFNRQHFRAAAASACGHGTIHDQLTFTSLSPAAKALLEGTIPPDWYGNEELLREFLTSFIIPDSTKHLPPIDTCITNSDVHKGFSQWREKLQHPLQEGTLDTTRQSFKTKRSLHASPNISISFLKKA